MTLTQHVLNALLDATSKLEFENVQLCPSGYMPARSLSLIHDHTPASYGRAFAIGIALNVGFDVKARVRRGYPPQATLD